MSDEARAGGIHQLVPRLEVHDATGNHTRLLQEALRAAGWRSEIFVHEMLEQTSHRTRLVSELSEATSPSDVLVYQFATASPIVDVLVHERRRLVINYHNVTPPEFYVDWDSSVAQSLKLARRQLRRIAPKAVLGIADSDFNAVDLVAAGCRNTRVIPVLFDPGRTSDGVDESTARRLRSLRETGGAQWLFVGRGVPPKAQHRLVMALWVYRRIYDRSARLHLVGAGDVGRYLDVVKDYAEEIGLGPAVEFIGGVDDRTLAAYYSEADVYTSMSQHEGFGIPLVEAMASGLPVVALGAGAVKGTLGHGGLVLDGAGPRRMAATVHRVVTDAQLRARLERAGRKRAADFALDKGLDLAVRTLEEVAHSEA